MTDLQGHLYALVVGGLHALDTGKATAMRVTDDFRLTLPHTVLTGDEWAEFLSARAHADYVTRHCVANFRVVDDRGTSATVAYVVTAYRLEAFDTTASVTVADFVDDWVLADDEWRHRARTISPVMPVRV